jgi:ketosteroid isomerase-like protein
MITDTPDAVLVQDAFDAFDAGDFDRLSGILAEDLVWESTGAHQLAGVYTGREEVFGFLGRAVELTEDTLRPQPLDIAGTDGRVLVRARTVGRRPDGRSIEVEEFLVFDIEEGRVRKVRTLVPDAETWNAFWT